MHFITLQIRSFLLIPFPIASLYSHTVVSCGKLIQPLSWWMLMYVLITFVLMWNLLKISNVFTNIIVYRLQYVWPWLTLIMINCQLNQIYFLWVCWIFAIDTYFSGFITYTAAHHSHVIHLCIQLIGLTPMGTVDIDILYDTSLVAAKPCL